MKLIKSRNASLGAHGFTIPAWNEGKSQVHYEQITGPSAYTLGFVLQSYQQHGYDCIMREFQIETSFDQTVALMEQLGYVHAVLPELDIFDQQFGTAPDKIRMALGSSAAFRGRRIWFAGSYMATLEATPQPALQLVSWTDVKTGRRAYMQDPRRYTLLGARRLN